MPFKCRQCPHREFATRTALQQHYRASIGHHFCHVCDLRFNDQPSFEAHNAATHPEFECTTCKQVFLTQTALEAHYRGKASSIHPNCPRCGKGFLNQRCLSEHQQTAHPTVICTCGVRILEEDLAIHYLNSVMHPSCTKCGIGFKDDAAYDGHGDVVHSDSRCAVCRRQFPNLDELGHHFVSSPDHPNCNKCDTPVGFLDDAALHNVGIQFQH
ncbi:hypothetical protein C8R44DRAFT_693177 [Mycena epipterygia]|nr:hypothetical protein C8R44DRAFT_693177 [Mycena epipterygia]